MEPFEKFIWRRAVGPRYTLHEQIGSGSYGDVCRATDTDTRETIALKVSTRPLLVESGS